MNGTQFPTPRGVYSFNGGFSRNPQVATGPGHGMAAFLLGFVLIAALSARGIVGATLIGILATRYHTRRAG